MEAVRSAGPYDADTDIMRLAAAFFVAVIHAAWSDAAGAVAWSTLARFSVPVFIIISGYYMLPKAAPLSGLVRKCAVLFGQMLFWAAVYFCYYTLCSGSVSYEGPRELVRYLLTEPVHLWYVYVVIALYLATPVLAVFYRNADRREYLYALAVCFGLGCVLLFLVRLDVSATLSAVVDKAKIPCMLGFPGLYLLGGYFRRFPVRGRSAGVLYALGAAGALAAMALMLPEGTRAVRSPVLWSFFSPNAVLSGAAFFVLVQNLCARRPVGEKRAARLHAAAGCTMGIYFLHLLALDLLLDLGFAPPLSQWLLTPLKAAIACAVAGIAVFLLKKVPVLRHTVCFVKNRRKG